VEEKDIIFLFLFTGKELVFQEKLVFLGKRECL
jgi:hypothetical protein